MKKIGAKFFLTAIIFTLINVIPSYADNTFYWNGHKIQETDDESIILPRNVKESRGETRGEVISTGIVEITDELDGNVGVSIHTYAHVPCDRICNALTLQRWDDSKEEWIQVIRFDFEAKKEDNPEEKLTYLINSVLVEDLPAGSYRAKGLHAVYLNGEYEGYSSKTHGIQITR